MRFVPQHILLAIKIKGFHHRGHREILKLSGLFSVIFSVISVRSSERSERVVKRFSDFFGTTTPTRKEVIA
jgi:hypothetical protein